MLGGQNEETEHDLLIKQISTRVIIRKTTEVLNFFQTQGSDPKHNIHAALNTYNN